MDDGRKSAGSWWGTMPGVLTATAGIITALTGLIVALHQTGMFNGRESAAPGNPVVVQTPPSPSSRSNAPATSAPPANVKAEAPQASSLPSTSSPSGINLLANENGGQLLLAPNDEWSATIDAIESEHRSVRVGEEAVFAFKDEHPATFDSFAMLIPKSGRNPKEFELFVADAAPTGPFRSIGTFQPQNVRVMKTQGWQEFKFPAVTAKYLKVKLKSNYEDVVWIELYEFRLRGQLKE